MSSKRRARSSTGNRARPCAASAIALESAAKAAWSTGAALLGPSAIDSADLGHNARVVLTLAADTRRFISYTSGRLPFDPRAEDVFEFGLRVNLQQSAALAPRPATGVVILASLRAADRSSGV